GSRTRADRGRDDPIGLPPERDLSRIGLVLPSGGVLELASAAKERAPACGPDRGLLLLKRVVELGFFPRHDIDVSHARSPLAAPKSCESVCMVFTAAAMESAVAQ